MKEIKIEMSESGKIAKLYDNSKLIAVLRIHGFLDRSLAMNGGYVYYGEAFQLANYEILNVERETVEER